MGACCDDPVVRSAVPPYEQIAADLRRRIDQGEFRSGDQLPPVSQLADHYGHSRRTVSKALQLLADDGLVTIRPGWGTHGR